MPEELHRGNDLLRAALGPGPDCPSIEELGHYLDRTGDEVWRKALGTHISGCTHCQTEVHLMAEFEAGAVGEADVAAVNAIAEKLRARAGEMVRQSAPPREARQSWWQKTIARGWLMPSVVTLAGLLVVAGIGLELRPVSAPPLDVPGETGREVMRSGALTIVAPVGDLESAPQQMEWQVVAGAVRYQVRVLEVDRNPLWQSETSSNRIDVPAEIRNRMVPGKTLLCEITAFDAGGAKLAESEATRFRVNLKIH